MAIRRTLDLRDEQREELACHRDHDPRPWVRGRCAALRLYDYDQLGVLTPAYTDPGTRYRYYRTEQLREARLIRAMRQMDMPLTIIRRVLTASPAEAERLLDDYLRTMEARVAQARRAVPNLISALR